MNHIHLVNDSIIGSYGWQGKLDLVNIVMIGLSKELPGYDETYELHRLLGTLLSNKLTADERLNIIGAEYDIPVEETIRKDVKVMCNLSQGIEEKGIEIGKELGKEIGKEIGKVEVIIRMNKKGYTMDQIVDITGVSEEKVKEVIKNQKQ